MEGVAPLLIDLSAFEREDCSLGETTVFVGVELRLLFAFVRLGSLALPAVLLVRESLAFAGSMRCGGGFLGRLRGHLEFAFKRETKVTNGVRDRSAVLHYHRRKGGDRPVIPVRTH